MRALVFVLVSAPVFAQVNAEVLKANPWKPGVAVGLDGSLFLSRGNVSLLDAGGAARAQWQSLHPDAGDGGRWVFHRAMLLATARYSDTPKGPLISQTFAHARWTAMWHPRVGTDVFAQFQTNLFLRMQARAVGGPGLRVEALRTDHLAIWGGSTVMFEYDRLSPRDGAVDRLETFDVRWSTYLTLRLSVADARLLVQNTTYAQPRFDAFADARFLNETEVMARVNDLLMFGFTVGVLHDTQPPAGVVATDLRLLSTLRLSFEWAAPVKATSTERAEQLKKTPATSG